MSKSTITRKNATIGLDTTDTRTLRGRTLYRVVALASIAALNVQEGQRGGWCSEQSIVTDRVQWVAPDATFWGGTFEGGTFEGGTFWGGTFWGGTFRGGTFWGGTFWGGTFWGGTFRGGTFEGGTFEGGTFWGGTFEGGTSTAKQPVVLTGFMYAVTITDEHMTIGCQTHPFSDWWKFTPQEVAHLGGPSAESGDWVEHKHVLRAIVTASGR